MTLVLQTSKWSSTLWQSHVAHSRAARQLIAAGTQKQPEYGGFADDVHASLYLRQRPETVEDAPQWATDLLQQAEALAEWKPLKARCMARGFAAGICTERVLHGLTDLVPQAEEPPDPDPGTSRRRLRQALRDAGKAVDAADAALEGLVPGGAGGPSGQDDSFVRLEQVRALWAMLQQNNTMQMMAQMAGRLQRLIASHKRSQAQCRVGAITGLTIGGDLPRLVPSELAGLRAWRLARLQVLAKIQGRRALQYEMRGETPETRGPIILLLDKSGSLSDEQVAWEGALGLTLAQICAAQYRTFAVVNFDDDLHDAQVVDAGTGVSLALCQALCRATNGSTDFEPPLAQALRWLRASPVLAKADVFFCTDGQPNRPTAREPRGGFPAPDTLAALQHLRETEGLSVFGIAIGGNARLDTIQAIATATYHLSARPQEDQGDLVPLLAAVA